MLNFFGEVSLKCGWTRVIKNKSFFENYPVVVYMKRGLLRLSLCVSNIVQNQRSELVRAKCTVGKLSFTVRMKSLLADNEFVGSMYQPFVFRKIVIRHVMVVEGEIRRRLAACRPQVQRWVEDIETLCMSTVVGGCRFIRVFTDPCSERLLPKSVPGSFVMFVDCKTGLLTFQNPTKDCDGPRWTVEVARFKGLKNGSKQHAKYYAECCSGWVRITGLGSHLTLLSSLDEYITIHNNT